MLYCGWRLLIGSGTGDIRDTGHKQGKHHAVNVPLQDGMDDHSYEFIFKPIMSKVMEVYRPTAIVLQCGADSLTGDRLGCFNLTLKVKGNLGRAVRCVSAVLCTETLRYCYSRGMLLAWST